MSITSQTTTQMRWRATLAGGTTVTLAPACFGATLTLSEPGRALTLALTPEQVQEMAQWETADRVAMDTDARYWEFIVPRPNTRTAHCHEDVWRFATTTRLRTAPFTKVVDECNDIATLRALARAYQETQPPCIPHQDVVK